MVLVTSSVGCISEDRLIVVLLVVLCSKVESVTVATSIATVELSGEICEPSMVEFSVYWSGDLIICVCFIINCCAITRCIWIRWSRTFPCNRNVHWIGILIIWFCFNCWTFKRRLCILSGGILRYNRNVRWSGDLIVSSLCFLWNCIDMKTEIFGI